MLNDQSASEAKKAKVVAPVRFHMHIYVYLLVAILLLCIGSFIGCFRAHRSAGAWGNAWRCHHAGLS